MSEVKHTPGPWEIEDGPNGLPYIGAGEGPDHGLEICDLIGEQMGAPEIHANARLIAAAPDMKHSGTALADVVRGLIEAGQIDWANGEAPILHGLLDEWDAAIAKAEGGE